MIRVVGKLVRDDRGATAIEYGLILGLVVVAIMAGIATLGGATHGVWDNMSTKVVSA